MNENLEILSVASFTGSFSAFEVINENSVIAIEKLCSNNLRVFDFSKGKLNSRIVINTEGSLEVVKKISDDKFAYIWKNYVFIRNIEGHLLHKFSSVDKYYESISKLSDALIIASFCRFGFQIWNIESGRLVKEMTECELVGTCSFGFLARKSTEPLMLHAFDMNGNFIGVIFTDKIGPERIEKFAQLGNDLFYFQFQNNFKLVKCKLKWRIKNIYLLKFIHVFLR
jgi:hypothetical protein